jgi:hypothetical protein
LTRSSTGSLPKAKTTPTRADAKADELRQKWATIKAAFADPQLRRLMSEEHLRYQADIAAGRIQ